MVFIDEAAFRKMIREEAKEALKEVVGEKRSTTSSPRETNDLLSYTSAGAAVELSANTIRDWVSQGKITGYGSGRNKRVRLSDVQAYLSRANEAETTEADIDDRVSTIMRRKG